MIILGYTSVWLGCWMTYQSSSRSKLPTQFATKRISWGVFIVTSLLSGYLLSLTYGEIAGILVTLILVMFMWVSLVLAAPFMNSNAVKVLLIGFCLFTLIGLLGERNVA